MNLLLRPASAADAAALAHIYSAAVHHISPALFSAAQKAAWLQGGADTAAFWAQRIPRTRPMVAERHGEVAGFIEYLPAEAYIDCLYVHPTHQGQGVGSALLSHVLSLAQTQAPTPLCADAAITALPLFLRHGFTLLHENRIRRHGEILVNYRVQKAWRPAKPS
jgi:putative acetyltransferase